MLPRLLLLVVLLGFVATTSLPGQPKKTDPKTAPKILVATPLGVPAGAKTRVTVRGLRLDMASEVRVQEAGVSVKMLGKRKVNVPNQQDPNKIGDSEVELEVAVAADCKAESARLSVTTPQGDSPAHALLIDHKPVLAEKEPNNGFRTAQPIQVPQMVEGKISQAQDVDVFRLEGKEGQQLVIEVLADRHGSPLDSMLTLHTEAGVLIASSDDIPGSTDSRIEVTLPRSGVYFVSVIDAHDQGGPTHVYRLVVRPR